MWIPTLLVRGWVKTIPSYSHGPGLGIRNRYFRYIHQSSIRPFGQSWMLQSPVCQTPAGKSEKFGTARTSLINMVVRTPVILPQSSITILLPDGQSRQWYHATQHLFESFIVANKPATELVPRCQCIVAAATILCTTSCHLHAGIWSTMSGRNQIMMVRHCAHIQDASRRQKPASECLNRSFNRGLSGSSDTLKSSEATLLIILTITITALWLMRMWPGYASTITLRILPLQAVWPIGSVQVAAQLQISHCEDGMHWLDCSSRICIVGGYLSGTLEGGQMGDNLEFFGEVLGLFLVFCIFYYYIIHIHAWRVVLRVHDVGINSWDICFWERHSGSDQTPCMAIM